MQHHERIALPLKIILRTLSIVETAPVVPVLERRNLRRNWILLERFGL